MKRNIIISILLLTVVSASAQDYTPTVNWPYLNPDFYEGEMRFMDGKRSQSKFNIHLGHGALHMVDTDGIIGETSVDDALSVRIGDVEFYNVGGKMLKVLAKSDKGMVVEESLANYAAVSRKDGAFGGGNANSAQGHSYDENFGNDAYLITNRYDDLLSQKEYGEELPMTVSRFILVDGVSVPAAKRDVSAIDGVDKKALTVFLKEEKINWKNPQDLLKVIDYIAK